MTNPPSSSSSLQSPAHLAHTPVPNEVRPGGRSPSDAATSAAADWLGGLYLGLASITDPRCRRAYPLCDLLFCALCAVTSGADSFTDIAEFTATKQEWLQRFISMSDFRPSHDTFRYVFMLVRPEAMHQVLSQYLLPPPPASPSGNHIAIDGKTIRGSAKRSIGTARKAIHLVRAYATEQGLCIGYQPCAEKSNEITALPQLLQSLNLNGSLVTMDAMGTQREAVKQIVDQGGDYLIALKGNQSGAFDAVEARSILLKEALAVMEQTQSPSGAKADTPQPQDPECPSPLPEHKQKRLKAAAIAELKSFKRHSTRELNRGRYEQRDYFMLTDLSWWPKSWKWEGLTAVIFVRQKTLNNGSQTDEPSEEWFYFLCSVEASVEQIAEWIRRHWRIENSCHHVLDVTFDEDHCKVRDTQASINLSIHRDIATALLRAQNPKQSLAAKRKKAAWDDSFRSGLFSHILHA
jgi:predicted transposase YbfD/YdcC